MEAGWTTPAPAASRAAPSSTGRRARALGILDFVGIDGKSWEVVTERVVNCAEINAMAWRWDLTTRLSQHARRVVAPTHWLISTQIIELLAFVEGELAKEE